MSKVGCTQGKILDELTIQSWTKRVIEQREDLFLSFRKKKKSRFFLTDYLRILFIHAIFFIFKWSNIVLCAKLTVWVSYNMFIQ